MNGSDKADWQWWSHDQLPVSSMGVMKEWKPQPGHWQFTNIPYCPSDYPAGSLCTSLKGIL